MAVEMLCFVLGVLGSLMVISAVLWAWDMESRRRRYVAHARRLDAIARERVVRRSASDDPSRGAGDDRRQK